MVLVLVIIMMTLMRMMMGSVIMDYFEAHSDSKEAVLIVILKHCIVIINYVIIIVKHCHHLCHHQNWRTLTRESSCHLKPPAG